MLDFVVHLLQPHGIGLDPGMGAENSSGFVEVKNKGTLRWTRVLLRCLERERARHFLRVTRVHSKRFENPNLSLVFIVPSPADIEYIFCP